MESSRIRPSFPLLFSSWSRERHGGGEIDKLSGWKMQNRYLLIHRAVSPNLTQVSYTGRAVLFCVRARVSSTRAMNSGRGPCYAHKFRHGAASWLSYKGARCEKLHTVSVWVRSSLFSRTVTGRGVAALSTWTASGSCTHVRMNWIKILWIFLFYPGFSTLFFEKNYVTIFMLLDAGF